MPTVPLSTFVDFTVAQGTARVGAVASSEEDYDPRKDFYKGFRERAIRQFIDGWNARQFRQSLKPVMTPRKQNSYEACRSGITQWARNKAIAGKRGSPVNWEAAGLAVRVNPELRLTVDGKRLVVKLYFKAPEMSAPRRENTLFLLSETAPQGFTAAILDAQRGELMTAGELDPDIDALLVSDAAAFASLLK